MGAFDYLRVLVDWNRNTAYDHALSDVTGRVRSATWSYGYNAPDQLVAPPATGMLILDNSDGAFNVNNPSAAFTDILRRGTLVKFLHTVGPSPGVETGAAALGILRITDIQIAPDSSGERALVLTLGDWHNELMGALYDPPLTLNTTTGDAIAAAFATGLLPVPYASRSWIMGASALGTDTRLFNNSAFEIPNGYTTLEYVGDNTDTGRGNTLYAFVEEMCAAEMDGRFFLKPTDGGPVYFFYSRNQLAERYSADALISLPASEFTDTGAQYEYARTLCNSLEVTMYPRRVGSAGTELARSQSAFRLQPGETRTISLRYRDPDYPDGTCTATTIVQPVAGTDYTANSAQDGSGTDLTASLGVSVVSKTSSADVIVVNTGAQQVYVTLLKLRGTPLTARQPLTVYAVDAQSIHDYGLHRAALTVAGVNNQELVQQYANSYVNRRKDPQARYRVVRFQFPDVPSGDLYRAAFNVLSDIYGVRIVDDWMEDPTQARALWIAGVQHSVSVETQAWEVTWYLEDFIQQAAWRFDDVLITPDGTIALAGLSVLGVTTRLGF